MTQYLLSFLLIFSISATTTLANVEIRQTYAIVNSGIGNTYFAGGINTDGASPTFNGTGFGTPASLTLNGGEVKSLKDGTSDVTGAFLYYRVYKQSDTAPAFVELNLPFDSNIGGGNQKWAATAENIDVLALATAGNGDYFLEIYWKITTNEGDRFDSNSGANFKASFSINVLPVELSSFSATPNKNQVELNWQTAQEINNDYFQIERKTANSHAWKVIGKKQGAGDSDSEIQYNFFDTKPANGINFYRLKQIDFDGQFEYSEMVNVQIRTTISIEIFPNPTVSELTIVTPVDFLKGEIHLYDATGKMIISTTVRERNYLNLSSLNSGIYFLDYWTKIKI